jgi:hypothetical protein
MNHITGYRLLIWSEKPDKLQEFYRDALQLEPTTKLTLSNDYGYGLKITDTMRLWIGKHSEVTGKNKDPFRHIVNLYVEDVFEWYEKLKDRKDVTIIQVPVETPLSKPENKKYVFTFLDPEGNCLQFMNPS